MNTDNTFDSSAAGAQSFDVSEITISQLVGEIYSAAPAIDQTHLLEQLLRPLGVLSLVAIAGGVFAKIRFRGGWPELHVRLEDAQAVQTTDVITLVDYVQQVSVETVDGLAQTLTASPLLMSSGAGALLLTLLVRRSLNRRARVGQGHAGSADSS